MSPEYSRLVALYSSQDASVFGAFLTAIFFLLGYAFIRRAAQKWQWLTWLYAVVVLAIYVTVNIVIMGVTL